MISVFLFLNSYQTNAVMSQSFEEEVESRLWAATHHIPKGLLNGIAAVSVSPIVFIVSCPAPFCPLQREGELSGHPGSDV